MGQLETLPYWRCGTFLKQLQRPAVVTVPPSSRHMSSRAFRLPCLDCTAYSGRLRVSRTFKCVPYTPDYPDLATRLQPTRKRSPTLPGVGASKCCLLVSAFPKFSGTRPLLFLVYGIPEHSLPSDWVLATRKAAKQATGAAATAGPVVVLRSHKFRV